MSDNTADSLNIRDTLARIDRNQAETRKLLAEAADLNRDRFLAPALALAATLGAIATFAPTIVRMIGGTDEPYPATGLPGPAALVAAGFGGGAGVR